MDTISLDQLSDQDLLACVRHAVEDERHATERLIALLIELDTRKLYLAEGCSSLFTYCTQILHLSEHAAYLRIEAARAARRFPIVLERLADGSINLTAVGLLTSHLTSANHREVLDAATHKRKSEIELMVARLRPLPDVPATVRKLPDRKPTAVVDQRAVTQMTELPPIPCASGCEQPAAPPAIASRPAEVTPLSPERYKIQFTVNRETHERLRRAQDLLRHTIPTGDPAAIFERALALLVSVLEKKTLAAAGRPRQALVAKSRSRHVPASVQRTVWQRDGGRCAFKGVQGRCTETGFLEFHHLLPFAAGGATTVQNLELRCRAHNAYEADQYFGPRHRLAVKEVQDR